MFCFNKKTKNKKGKIFQRCATHTHNFKHFQWKREKFKFKNSISKNIFFHIKKKEEKKSFSFLPLATIKFNWQGITGMKEDDDDDEGDGEEVEKFKI